MKQQPRRRVLLVQEWKHRKRPCCPQWCDVGGLIVSLQGLCPICIHGTHKKLLVVNSTVTLIFSIPGKAGNKRVSNPTTLNGEALEVPGLKAITGSLRDIWKLSDNCLWWSTRHEQANLCHNWESMLLMPGPLILVLIVLWKVSGFHFIAAVFHFLPTTFHHVLPASAIFCFFKLWPL